MAICPTPEKAFRTHLWMLFCAAAIATALSVLWYLLFFQLSINLGKADETALTNMLVPSLIVLWAILAGHTMIEAWKRYDFRMQCVHTGKRKEFYEVLGHRVPGTIKLLLGVFSIIPLLTLMLVSYANPWTGILAVGTVGFGMALYYEIIKSLDDVHRGVWYVGIVPCEFYEPLGATPSSAPASP